MKKLIKKTTDFIKNRTGIGDIISYRGQLESHSDLTCLVEYNKLTDVKEDERAISTIIFHSVELDNMPTVGDTIIFNNDRYSVIEFTIVGEKFDIQAIKSQHQRGRV